MDRAELLQLGDLNLAESYREMARWHARSELCERDSILLTCGPDSFPALSFAMRIHPEARPDVEVLLRIAKAFFAERKRSFSIRVRSHVDADLDQACQALGLLRVADNPGMVIDGPLPGLPSLSGDELRSVRDVETARAFASVAADAYATSGLRRESAARLFALPERLLAPHVLAVVGYIDHVPCSCAMALLSHGIAGIYWVGTIPQARGRGLAAACTRSVGNEAFARGARCVVLQASDQGEPVYRRMGYREFTRYPWYVCPSR
jgi:ribosomal protein S18 acetylase RimI-like enzyme